MTLKKTWRRQQVQRPGKLQLIGDAGLVGSHRVRLEKSVGALGLQGWGGLHTALDPEGGSHREEGHGDPALRPRPHPVQSTFSCPHDCKRFLPLPSDYQLLSVESAALVQTLRAENLKPSKA